MSAARLEASGVRVTRGGRVLVDVERLALESGEILALVGPNGAGKSTLLLALGLLLSPDAGEVRVGGEAAHRHNTHALRRRLAYVFQSPLLLDASVRANVELGLRLRGFGSKERRSRTDLWLSTLGLAGLKTRRARTLSGGEAQRVNLARALALAPEALLLDEPLSGLDAPSRAALMEELGPLVRRGPGAALLVTHDRGEALALGDRIAVMLDGSVRQVGSPAEIFSRPRDEQVARFLGVENILPGEVSGSMIRLTDGLVLRGGEGAEGRVSVCLRAEEVRLAAAGSA
ncbi:MAG: ABC transporter ATP-binding protein, partial [Deltaproteobacteria bacterium]|nr:ABC transporter ATP-binding protein [Deltaproteobacteria bacterium]